MERREALRERDRRYGRLRREMAAAGLDGLLAFAPGWRRENVRYLSGAATRGSFTLVYLPAIGPPTAFAASVPDRQSIAREGWVEDVRPLTLPHCPEVGERLREGGSPEHVGIAHLELLPQALLASLERQMPTLRFSSATSLMERVRHVKSEWELQRLREAARVCDAGWPTFLQALRPGVREYEVVATVEAALKELGAEDNFMIIASGRGEVRGMTPPGNRPLERGDMVRTELTPQIGGYWIQICRSAVLGEPDEGQRRSHELFREALEAGLAVARAGVTAHEIAKAQNDVFRKYGYGEYTTSRYTRVRGHGHGLHLDEAPALLEGVDMVLEENSVIIIHPNTFTPLAGYYVLGDPVVVKKNGCQRLLNTECTLFTVH